MCAQYVQPPTGKMSDHEVLEALQAQMRIPGSVDVDQERLDKNIIIPKSAGLAGKPDELSLDLSMYKHKLEKASGTQIIDDTIHYLSPATASPISARTVDEGDIFASIYKTPSFMRVLQEYGVSEGSYVSSTISCIEPELQRTVAIIKPEAMEYEDVIVRAIVDAGFSVIRKRYIHLTPEQVSELYSQYYGSPAFPYMVVKMSVGPILSLCLAGLNAVEKWKNLVGPERAVRAEWFYPLSMRVRFGLHEEIPGGVHASNTLPEANKENRYINPESILEPLITDENKVCDFCNMYINPTLLNGLAEVVRAKPKDAVVHLADWLLKNNPFQPRFPQDVAFAPT